MFGKLKVEATGFQRDFEALRSTADSVTMVSVGEAKQSEIAVLVWESNGKQLFPKSNFTQFVNRKVKISAGRLYSPSLKDVA